MLESEREVKRQKDIDDVIQTLKDLPYRLPVGSVKRKKKAQLDKLCVRLKPTSTQHCQFPRAFGAQWTLLDKASSADDKDWLIQDDSLSLHMVYAILRSKISLFWFRETMPPNVTLGKARLLSFPMPADMSEEALDNT